MALKNNWTKSSKSAKKAAMLSVFLFTAGIWSSTLSFAGTIQQIAATENTVTIYFDDVVNKASVFTLAGPNRIAVDITGAKAGLNNNSGYSIRQGQFDADTARVVMDLDAPAVLSSGQFSSDGRSLQLQIRQAGFVDFSGKAETSRTEIVPPAQFRASPPKKKYEVTVPIGKGRQAAGMPKIYGPSDTSLPLVVIDAGHGGHDPGAINPQSGKREKDVTLAIARSVRDELIKTGRVRVALTRDGDLFLVLQDRYGIARKMGADLFMSIHADSAENSEASGATVYTLSETASDREAQKLAARENKADIINGINLGGADANVSSILIDLTQRETMNVSADFAKILLREAKPNMRLRANSHKFASFIVLKAPDTPSVLFETGYISNAQDAAFLSSAAGQATIGKSVASAIQVHFARRLTKK
jgi:N-acetylmuramoyl-L-alanine amidase